MSGKLCGKVALITGTGGYQGRAAALLFSREGAKVVGCDWNSESAEKTLRLVKDTGGEMISLQPVDLGDGNQVKKWIDFAVKAYGQIDILYNNASSPKFAPVEKMTEEEWHYTIRNELDIIYWTCHHAWEYLKASGNGIVINTASVSGLIGITTDLSPNFAHAATKGGVIALTRQLAIEGARYNIRANCITPGIMAHPALEQCQQNPELKDILLNLVPLHRFCEAEEIARVALFLASDDSSYITGANIVVDGGITAQ